MPSLKKIGRKIGRIFSTGKSAAKRTERQANIASAQAQGQRQVLEEKTKKERLKSQKLAIKGMRSRRAAQQRAGLGEASARYQGSSTIG